MDNFVKEIEGFGNHIKDRFIEKNRVLTNDERYSILKLAEFCIQVSKESGKNEIKGGAE